MNWDIIGHDWAVNLLKAHLTKKRFRHAYLLTGPVGIGKRALATGFIRAINCLDPPQEGEFCGACRPCMLIKEQAYPDLHVVAIEENERVIRVEKIRALRRSLSLSPNLGSRRMALLVDFHIATEQASNALLKTLEEPPPNVILILTAESKETLLPTIVSRCEVIALRTVSTDDIAAFIVTQGESKERANLIAGISNGRPGWAISVLRNPAILKKREQLLDELTKLIVDDRQSRFMYVRDWNDSLRKQYPVLDDRRKECLGVLELWLGYWRDVMLVALGNMETKGNPDRDADINIHSSGIPKPLIMQALKSIQDTIVAIDQNANIQLALEALMIDMPRYEQGHSS